MRKLIAWIKSAWHQLLKALGIEKDPLPAGERFDYPFDHNFE